jgi:hypothetical protein
VIPRKVKGSVEDGWAVVSDLGSWARWFPLGAPQLVGPAWQQGSHLVWSAPGGATTASAIIDRLEVTPAKTLLSFTYASGTDGLPLKKGVPVSWDIVIAAVYRGTDLACTRWQGSRKPPTTLPAQLRQRKIAKAEAATATSLAGLVETVARSRGPLPDVDALRAAGDTDGLCAAMRHPEVWVRASALDALPFAVSDPVAVEALLAAANDPSELIRLASINRLSRVDDDRAQKSLLTLRDDPDPAVRGAAGGVTKGLLATIAAAATSPYGTDELARLRAGAGPQFAGEPTELFLGSRLAVYLNPFLVYEEAAGGRTFDSAGVEHSSVESKLQFPDLCAGCLEPTERSLLGMPHQLSWSRSTTSGSTVHTRTTNVRISFPIRMCERCVAYGLDRLVHVSSESRSDAFEANQQIDWVRFQFPNLAYYEPFRAAVGVAPDAIRPLGKKGEVLFAVRRLPKLSKDDVAARDAALEMWSWCLANLGFHLYAHLKHRLAQLDPATTQPATLSALGAEYSVDLELLRVVETVAGAPLPALRALDG